MYPINNNNPFDILAVLNGTATPVHEDRTARTYEQELFDALTAEEQHAVALMHFKKQYAPQCTAAPTAPATALPAPASPAPAPAAPTAPVDANYVTKDVMDQMFKNFANMLDLRDLKRQKKSDLYAQSIALTVATTNPATPAQAHARYTTACGKVDRAQSETEVLAVTL
jgi:hypothetical protein